MNKSLIVLKMFLPGVYSVIEVLLFLTPKAVMGAHSPKAQITGGREVKNASAYTFYVHMALWNDTRPNEPEMYGMCGGTIINNTHVLSAAHCVRAYDWPQQKMVWVSPHLIKLYSGSLTARLDDETDHAQKHDVKFYYKPSVNDDNIETRGFDIVVLVLEKSIVFDAYRQSLKPCEGQAGLKNEDGNEIWAVGVGLTNSTAGTWPDVIMEARMNEIGDDLCRKVYNDTSPAGSVVCVRNSSKSLASNGNICNGDSGGPLFSVDKKTGKAVCLYGVASYTSGERPCGSFFYPSVSMRVASYMPYFQREGKEGTIGRIKVIDLTGHEAENQYRASIRIGNDGRHVYVNGLKMMSNSACLTLFVLKAVFTSF